ncbi:unnamed protein product [Malus baccata var. baccata]
MNLMENPLKASTKMCLLLFYSSLLLIIAAVFSAADGATSTFQSIADGETIVSDGGTFELGFFSPGALKNRYVGIWYKKIFVTTIVWVANRDTPLTDSSGVLKVTNPGLLVLLSHNMSTVWSSNTSRTAQNPVARLLDSGNLVVIDGSDVDPENYLWQSFDYPGDTFLPSAKLGRNTVTGFNWHFRSWKSPQDPSHGNYTYQLGPKGYAEKFVREGSVIKFRSGPWTGVHFQFSGTPQLNTNPIYTYSLVSEPDEIYYSYKLHNNSIISRVVLTSDGIVRRYTWIDRTKGWLLQLIAQIDNCACNIEKAPVCSCLKGFKPKYPKEWDLVDWSNGCMRNAPLNCSGDVFIQYSGIKLPSTEQSWHNRSMNLKESYTNLDIRDGGSGCLMWYGDLIDIRYFAENGQDIYIRMAASELDHEDDTKINAQYSESNVKKMRIIVTSIVLFTGLLILGLALLYVWKKKCQKDGKLRSNQKEDLKLPLFDLSDVVCATSDFSNHNKLGEGGFGSVFKIQVGNRMDFDLIRSDEFQDTLKDGQEIAVKRLSKHSRQGLNEFKNKVTHIAKLQHRNLVKLLGCCIQEDEMMLIYEFMPNKSVDFFIFDQRKSILLDWPKRFDIINGIARELLYLHQDSRLRVIHRDLKAGNILLDGEFNAKISDFGLARSFGGNETTAKTKKVVGTYGYMFPEYAIDGCYSIKSDVYSFCVMVLEIVNGKRNGGFSHPGHNLNLLGHAWNLYTEGMSIEVLDTSVGDSSNQHEVLRSIHVGLLCVKRNPEDRPSMPAAVLMLSGESALPQPQKPGFYSERDLDDNNVDPCANEGNPYGIREEKVRCDFLQRSDMAIGSSSYAIRGGIKRHELAAEYLSAIEKKFKESDKAEISQHMSFLTTYKIDNAGSIRDHIMKMTDAAEKLNSMEVNIGEKQLVFMILQALPNKYSQLKVSYNTQDKSKNFKHPKPSDKTAISAKNSFDFILGTARYIESGQQKGLFALYLEEQGIVAQYTTPELEQSSNVTSSIDYCHVLVYSQATDQHVEADYNKDPDQVMEQLEVTEMEHELSQHGTELIDSAVQNDCIQVQPQIRKSTITRKPAIPSDFRCHL